MGKFLRILLSIILFPGCLVLSIIAGIFVGITTAIEAIIELVNGIIYWDSTE